MNSGATSERVYDALKRRIQSGEFRPGARLDPALLAESEAASVTPVRDALHLLTGEGLVETRLSDGFHVPGVHEPGLTDLYRWSAQLVAIGIAQRGPATLTEPGPRRPDAASLFAAIVRRSDNGEHHRAIASVNDRLHRARVAEAEIFDGSEAELATLCATWEAGNLTELRKQVSAYHRRRIQRVPRIVRALYQA